ncbi:putative reverse transcriptase domain-containing protein, partial [Tanacetum coccineum]
RNTNHRKKTNIDSGTVSSTESDGIWNYASPLDASVAKKVVPPPVNLEPVAKEKQSSVEDASMPNVEITGMGSYPPLRTQGTNPAGNTPVVLVDSIRAISERFVNTAYGFFLGKRMAYHVWNPDVNLLKEDVGNVPVWVKLHGVPVTAFREDGLSVIATKLGTPLMLDSYTFDMCLQSWDRSSYDRAMIKLRADVELKDTIVEECPKNISLGVAKILKKPSQTPRGVSVGPKVGFQPTKEYRPISKKPIANTNGNKKKGVELPKSSISTTLIVDKIGKLEKLIIEGKATLMDNAGKPLNKVENPDDHDSEDEVESVDNDMARSMASKSVGFGIKSLLEQWMDSYENGDYDEDPYDDDMYEGQDIPDKIQDICDNLYIRVRRRKKKLILFSF